MDNRRALAIKLLAEAEEALDQAMTEVRIYAESREDDQDAHEAAIRVKRCHSVIVHTLASLATTGVAA